MREGGDKYIEMEVVSPGDVIKFNITAEAIDYKITEVFFGGLIPNDFNIFLELEKGGERGIRLILEVNADNSELEHIGITNFKVIEVGKIIYKFFHFNKILNIRQREFIERFLENKLEGASSVKNEFKGRVEGVIL